MKFTIFIIAAFLALSACGQSFSESIVNQWEAEEVETNIVGPGVTNSTKATYSCSCSGRAQNAEVLLWACDSTTTAPMLKSYSAAGSLMTQQLQSLFASHCALTGNHIWPADATDAVLEGRMEREKGSDAINYDTFDFIVVGAGSAGSVVANRLSENAGWRVLLVEAGGNPTIVTEIPQVFYNNLNSAEDWAYKTEPQEGACRGYKTKGCSLPRGKVLGGSSSINGMFYVRGNKKNFNDWAANGCEGWSYEEVLPYFKKSENYSQYTAENDQYHGSNGYLSVENNPNLSELENLVIKGFVELGLKNRTDINGADQMGVTKSCTTTRNGIRCSTARGFLSPIKDRKNLYVLKYAYATKLVFELGTNVIKGVLLYHKGEEIYVEATKEVIVSCGTINSAQLLLLSGIGPKKHLEELKIEVKADLPVGQNLQDHLFVPIMYTAPDPYPLLISNITETFAEYMFKHEGLLADTSPHRVIAFWNTTDPNAASPDMQNHNLIFSGGATKMVNFFEKHQFSDEIQQKFEAMNNDSIVIMACTVLLKPKSLGNITLKSNDPMDNPIIYANYFEDAEDMETVIRGIRQISLQLGNTNAFKEAGFELEWLEIDACKDYEKQSDDHLDCMSREISISLYHLVGTVKMGAVDDDTAVVDSQLRVKNVEGLRVVDASIMPSIVSGNTNAASIMIGEKGADMIIEYWSEL